MQLETIVFDSPAMYAESALADYKPINPNLEGGLRIDPNKSTPNTTIIKEDIGPVRNTYIHHDRGPGRMTTNTTYKKN